MEPSPIKTFFHKPSRRIWIYIWCIIYSLIIGLGILTPGSNFFTTISLTSIILCLLYTLLIYPQDHLLHAAFLTTFISDIILAINNTSEIGLFLFFAVQMIHLIRLNDKKLTMPLILSVTFICAIIFDLWLRTIPLIFIICTFYAIALLSNVYLAWRWHQRQAKNWHASSAFFGFLLFACCDSCTAISYLSLTHVLPIVFYSLANYFAWFFYYPSQILVSNSSKCDIIDPKEGKC